MKSAISLIVTFLVSTILSAKIDYFWRNYDGKVPADAVPAGVDKTGKPIYVGQGYFGRAELFPATIHPGSTNMSIQAGQRVYSFNKNVKILCSGHPLYLQWTQVNNYDEIATLPNVHLVEGGTEAGTTLYIGRAEHEGSLEVGKIYNVYPDQSLSLPNSRMGETRYNSFDILTYNVVGNDCTCECNQRLLNLYFFV